MCDPGSKQRCLCTGSMWRLWARKRIRIATVGLAREAMAWHQRVSLSVHLQRGLSSCPAFCEPPWLPLRRSSSARVDPCAQLRHTFGIHVRSLPRGSEACPVPMWWWCGYATASREPPARACRAWADLQEAAAHWDTKWSHNPRRRGQSRCPEKGPL